MGETWRSQWSVLPTKCYWQFILWLVHLMTNKGLGTTSWLGRSGTGSIKWRRIQRGISRGISTILKVTVRATHSTLKRKYRALKITVSFKARSQCSRLIFTKSAFNKSYTCMCVQNTRLLKSPRTMKYMHHYRQ